MSGQISEDSTSHHGDTAYDSFDQYTFLDLKALYLALIDAEGTAPSDDTNDSLDRISREDLQNVIEMLAGDNSQLPFVREVPMKRSRSLPPIPAGDNLEDDEEDDDIVEVPMPMPAAKRRRPAEPASLPVTKSGTAALDVSPPSSRRSPSYQTAYEIVTPASGLATGSQASLIDATEKLDLDDTTVSGHGATSQHASSTALKKAAAPIDLDDVEVTAVEPIKGKGRGLVARRNIAVGQVIIAESPLLEVDHPPSATQVLNRVSRLTDAQRSMFDLFDAGPDAPEAADERLCHIVHRYFIPLGDDSKASSPGDGDSAGSDGDTGPSGLFRYICRVNHSCAPNARWTWYGGEVQRMKLIAIKPILAGAEITACYLQDPALGYVTRQKKLKSSWSFDCSCSKCSLPCRERTRSNKRLIAIRHIRKDFIGFSSEKEAQWEVVGLDACVKSIEFGIELLVNEELDSESPEWYATLFNASTRWGDAALAKKMGKKWLATSKKYGEADQTQSTIASVEDPSSSPYWRQFVESDDESDGGSDFEDPDALSQ